MAVTGSQKEGVTIEQLRSIDRRRMSAKAREEQSELLGVDRLRDGALGDWPLTGPENPESVKPKSDDLKALAPSDDQIRALTEGNEEDA